MSITVSTDVFCDECGTWTHGTTGVTALRYEARKRAKSQGWTLTKDHRDLCDTCSARWAIVYDLPREAL